MDEGSSGNEVVETQERRVERPRVKTKAWKKEDGTWERRALTSKEQEEMLEMLEMRRYERYVPCGNTMCGQPVDLEQGGACQVCVGRSPEEQMERKVWARMERDLRWPYAEMELGLGRWRGEEKIFEERRATRSDFWREELLRGEVENRSMEMGDPWDVHARDVKCMLCFGRNSGIEFWSTPLSWLRCPFG